MDALPGMYHDFHLPLGLHDLLEEACERNRDEPNTPQVTHPPANRMWLSQPRSGTDTTTEVLTVNFKLPLSISEVGWEALRRGCKIDLWYLDRQNNWRQMLDESRVPVTLKLSASQTASWYKAHFYCYPVVAKKLQWRFTRIYDPVVGLVPYSVGMRNGLIRRNVYTRADGSQGIEPWQDPLGNTFTSYIKDWDATQAFDNDPHTFWRSMPMPDPAAVCSLYLDTRLGDGSPQLMDALWLDPVYMNQTLNVYYSNDDTVGTTTLSSISAVSSTDENTSWQAGKGRWDISADPGTCEYTFGFSCGPLVSQDTWIGIEWAPDFASDAGPAQNPVLLSVIPPTGVSGGSQYWPTVFYDVGAGQLVLELTNGSTTQTYRTSTLSPLPVKNVPLRIVVGWGYTPKTVVLSVKLANGTELASYTGTPSDLPTQITLDGKISFTDFRGLFTAHVLKREHWTEGQDAFQANPTVYVSPDPVMPNPQGVVPSTTLDNAVYAACWTEQEHGTGGGHDSHYENKSWVPIWRDYISQKGRLIFPQQISAKYLKLEFTNLTEEPYPIFDSGIKVTYRVFPISVTKTYDQRKKHGHGHGLMELGANLQLGGVGSVNWLNPQTITAACNVIYGKTVQPMQVTIGPSYSTTSLPNTSQLDATAQTRQEVSSPWVYRRSPFNDHTLAAHWLKSSTTPLPQGLTVGPVTTDANTTAIADSFTPLVQSPSTPATLPTQGKDWWVFPGSNLRMPARVMEGLCHSSHTVCKRKPSTEIRLRFDTTCIHRYDVRTVIRDAAVGYFAGVREVQPLITSYIDELDPDVFRFSSYHDSQWVQTNLRALDAGPVTTAGPLYEVLNPGFDQNLAWWDYSMGIWNWDGSFTHGHWHRGSAHVTADGTEKMLRSSIVRVVPGAHIDASVWVSWENFTAAPNSDALQLQAQWFGDDTEESYISTDTVSVSYADWPATTPILAGNYWLQIVASEALENAFTVPEGATVLHFALVVTEDASAGDVWFDTIQLGTQDVTEGTVYKHFATTSTFAKLTCKFFDSGLIRSDDMWAREDPLATNINLTDLAYYTTTIPDVVPGGMWADSFGSWESSDITWGAPRALVAINVDPDRIYDGKRVLHFRRGSGAEEAGIKVRQMTNYVPDALFRIGAVFFKPYPNDNQVTVRLRRVSDGVYIHEETFTPVVGYWYEYITQFVEIPDSDDQIYTVELVCTGDDADDFYLNDLYTDVCNVRYFCRLGGGGEFLHDITPLVYASPPATVSATLPVNEASVTAAILSPRAYAYGCEITPTYLK